MYDAIQVWKRIINLKLKYATYYVKDILKSDQVSLVLTKLHLAIVLMRSMFYM